MRTPIASDTAATATTLPVSLTEMDMVICGRVSSADRDASLAGEKVGSGKRSSRVLSGTRESVCVYVIWQEVRRTGS